MGPCSGAGRRPHASDSARCSPRPSSFQGTGHIYGKHRDLQGHRRPPGGHLEFTSMRCDCPRPKNRSEEALFCSTASRGGDHPKRHPPPHHREVAPAPKGHQSQHRSESCGGVTGHVPTGLGLSSNGIICDDACLHEYT